MLSIGRFEIRRELGRGAQSVVYLAWDPQLQREVAIKTMHFGNAESGQNAALLAEARAIGKLCHPNVVPIFDAGEVEGDPYLVFEYVEGKSLADLLRDEGKLPPGKAVDLMRQVADALGEAHANNIIHRDLKPSNILIDGRGMPRVMDFGIAARVTEDQAAREKGLSGTPSYMAPEYVTRQEISPQNDVFAVGLILLELLTGVRAIRGTGVEQILHKVAREPIHIPKEAGIGERLTGIILRCCSLNPQARYTSAVQLKEALDAYVNAAGDAVQSDAQKQSTLDFLLRRMRHKSDFPALSESVLAINRLMDSDRESINNLSNSILKDYGLTNKILRLVNTAFYRQAGGGNISTVSRAVIVLGFDAVRNIATTVLLFEHLQNKRNARELKEAFLRTNLAALLAREASGAITPVEAEQAFICALFYGLGAMLAQYYFPEEVEAIGNLMQSKKISEKAASIRVLGLSYEDLGVGIAKTWGFPSTIVHSMYHLEPGSIKKPESHAETMRLLAGFSNEVCGAITACTPDDRGKLLRALLGRFAATMQLSENKLLATVEIAFDNLKGFASILQVVLRHSVFARQVLLFIGANTEPEPIMAIGEEDKLLATSLLNVEPVYASQTDVKSASDGAQAILSAGIQDISNSLVEDFSLNDILRIILETMYRAMGFRRVLLCLKDTKTNIMAGRFGFGPDTAELAKVLRFPIAYEPDVFHLATHKAADVIITDIDDPKIAERIPKWFREKITAKTFVLFPLTLKNNPVALIYCDDDKPNSIVIEQKELSLLKTLRNQALLAIKQTS